MTEEWRTPEKYPLYQVSSLGRVRKGRKPVNVTRRAGRGYVTLRRGGRRDTVPVARIVASTFIRPFKPHEKVVHRIGPSIDHAAALAIESKRANPKVAIDEAVRLRGQGYTYREITEKTGVKRQNTANAVKRAMERR